MRLKEISDKHPDYWRARHIDVLDPLRDDRARFQKAMKIVETHCREIIAVYKKAQRFLYRGVRAKGKDIFVAGIRSDRKAGFLQPWVAEEEPIVIKELGGKANRTNSIFCTASADVADNWGGTFVVFPKNGWSTTYFLKQGDLDYMYSDLTRIALEHDPDDDDYSPAKVRRSITSLYKRRGITFSKAGLAQNLIDHPRSEVLISGNSYIGIDFHKYGHLLQTWLEGKSLNTKPRSIKDVLKK